MLSLCIEWYEYDVLQCHTFTLNFKAQVLVKLQKVPQMLSVVMPLQVLYETISLILPYCNGSM